MIDFLLRLCYHPSMYVSDESKARIQWASLRAASYVNAMLATNPQLLSKAGLIHADFMNAILSTEHELD